MTSGNYRKISDIYSKIYYIKFKHVLGGYSFFPRFRLDLSYYLGHKT